MTEDKDQIIELKSVLEELRRPLLDASMHFEIWEGLWPTKQVVDVINRYKGFFMPTRKAILTKFSSRFAMSSVMTAGLPASIRFSKC